MHRYRTFFLLLTFIYVIQLRYSIINVSSVLTSIIFCKKLPAHFFSVATQLLIAVFSEKVFIHSLSLYARSYLAV